MSGERANDLRLAAEWCEAFEGDEPDRGRLRLVASWLRHKADVREQAGRYRGQSNRIRAARRRLARERGL